MPDSSPIIFYDGQCNLCIGALGFVIRQGGRNKFNFVSLQSDKAKVLLPENLLIKQSPDSIVYLDHEKIFYRSSAILRIMKQLGKGWGILYVFILVPRIIRDPIYDLIARNRYKWFGKREHCSLDSRDLPE